MFGGWLQKLWQSKKRVSSLIKVLIIEDNSVDAGIIKKAVALCGFKSLVANKGRIGIDMAIKHKPDLIILDYYLPDINGGQVLQNLRSNKKISSETVMVLSASNDPGIVIDSYTNGAGQFFTKPIDVTFLAQQIRVMVSEPHQEQGN